MLFLYKTTLDHHFISSTKRADGQFANTNAQAFKNYKLGRASLIKSITDL